MRGECLLRGTTIAGANAFCGSNDFCSGTTSDTISKMITYYIGKCESIGFRCSG